MALASVINFGNPSIVKNPEPIIQKVQVAEAHTVLKAQGDTLVSVPLWNTEDFSTTSNISLITEIPTTSLEAKNPALNTASKKNVFVELTMGPAAIEKAVEAYFADIPIMIRVAQCESQFRQIDIKTGEVLRGRVNGADRGVMQINQMYHGETAEKLGIDILTLEGNMTYARYLYQSQGTQPWSSSAKCWSPYVTDVLAQS